MSSDLINLQPFSFPWRSGDRAEGANPLIMLWSFLEPVHILKLPMACSHQTFNQHTKDTLHHCKNCKDFILGAVCQDPGTKSNIHFLGPAIFGEAFFNLPRRGRECFKDSVDQLCQVLLKDQVKCGLTKYFIGNLEDLFDGSRNQIGGC